MGHFQFSLLAAEPRGRGRKNTPSLPVWIFLAQSMTDGEAIHSQIPPLVAQGRHHTCSGHCKLKSQSRINNGASHRKILSLHLKKKERKKDISCLGGYGLFRDTKIGNSLEGRFSHIPSLSQTQQIFLCALDGSLQNIRALKKFIKAFEVALF